MMLRVIVLSLIILIFNGITEVEAELNGVPVHSTKIYIYVFQDDNKNGLLDSGEHGLDGWSFKVEGPEYSKKISVNSNIGFRVPPGEYFIQQVPKPNWVNTTKGEIDILIKPSERVKLYFGYYNTSCTSCSTPHINCSWTEPPQVDLTPETLSFSSPDWEKLVIWVDNPLLCHIINASIELKVPDGWTINPSIENTPIEYIIKDRVLQIDNFGSFQNKSVHDYIEVKPEEDALSEDSIIAISHIDYLYRYPNASFNLSCNISKEIKIKLMKKYDDGGISKMLKDNSVIISAIASAICAIITVLYGSGGNSRVNSIKNWIRK